MEAPTQNSTDATFVAADCALNQLIDLSQSTRTTFTQIHDNDTANQGYREAVAVALAMMEFDIAIARAEHEVNQAVGAHEMKSSISRISDSTKAWFEDAAVRTTLAGMDVRDRSDAVGEQLERAAAEARRLSTRVGEAIEGDLTEVRRIALEGIHAVRSSLGGAMHSIRNP